MPTNQEMRATADEILRQRGIYDACMQAGWEFSIQHDQPGWKYPLYTAGGKLWDTARWKNADSSGNPKYLFVPGKNDNARYYWQPDTIPAIRAAYGKVYIASGEADVMAFRAAGIKNVFCWFGEKNTPETLAEDLKRVGATLVYIYPDRDTTGMEWASRIHELITASADDAFGAPIIAALNAEIGSKYDINRLWIDCRFDAARFKNALGACAPIDTDTLELYAHKSYTRTRPQQLAPSAAELPAGFVAAIHADVMNRLPHGKVGADGWTENFPCVNPAHRDKNPSAGYNIQSNSYKCFSCGDFSAKQYGEFVGIRLADYYEHGKALAAGDAPKQQGQDVPPSQQSVITFQNSHNAINELISIIKGEARITDEPMLFPFKIMHQFGGFAQYMSTGKITFITGISGGGKTAYGEWITEYVVRGGMDVISYNPEWTSVEMMTRALARNGGLPTEAITALKIYLYDLQHGVPEKHRRGRLPEEFMRAQSLTILSEMAKWSGRTHSFDQGKYSLNGIIEASSALVEDLRAAGRNPKMMIFDYLQRAPKPGMQDWQWGEGVVTAIKTMCETYKLFGVIFTQPKKGDSRAVRGGEALTEASGQGVSDQQANLYLGISPVYTANGTPAPYSRIDVLKNSTGKTGHLFQAHDLARHRWADQEVDENGARVA